MLTYHNLPLFGRKTATLLIQSSSSKAPEKVWYIYACKEVNAKIVNIFTIYLILPESVKYAMFIYKIRKIQFNSDLVPKTPRDSVFTANFLCRYFLEILHWIYHMHPIRSLEPCWYNVRAEAEGHRAHQVSSQVGCNYSHSPILKGNRFSLI